MHNKRMRIVVGLLAVMLCGTALGLCTGRKDKG